ncbi:T9SS C-terminal target domain-containing protein [Aquimarina sp. AD1]|uniref:RICIN domain-containing protein n=1 Tax=Aquimarina sp. (strain AD1) TaxID=1714848 RepID=UPI000E542E29|nr:RICIN domain-containing protein [Aquimarina sp. AD1]AXT56156.1 T9SS C-terminal target domain-containing protein [Aquimarina sp. AD1]RKN28686.1 T9SS C-terminal target domain-containing protein [Aquimarina sp. AD1]
MKIKFLIGFLWVFCAQSLLAKDYYVATNGNDNNNGAISSPFKTFAKAVSVMKAGDVCVIREGVYTEPLVVNKKGTQNNYITFKAADGENVRIKATKFINGWQLHSGNIYKASVNMTLEERFRNVYHNQQYMDLARWPNNVDNNRFTVDCKFIDNGGSNYFSVSGTPNFDWTGGLVYYIGGHSGTSWTRRITRSAGNRIEHAGVNINKWPFNPHNPTIVRNGHRGQLYLFNKFEALDYAREWYYDTVTKTLYFQPANGKKPANNTVEYATRKFIAEVKGDYIKIEGIEFFGGSVKINGRSNIFENNKVIHGSEGFDNINSTSAGVGESSIEVLGPNTIIRNCTINHSSANGISVQSWANAHNSIIEKNTISNIDYLGIHATPIRTRANNVKVLKNKITNSGRDGMYVSGDNCEVAYNDVSRAQLINADSGVFYTVGDDRRKGTEIHHNWFHDSKPPSYAGNKAAGIYLDNNSKGYVVHHNVVWNVSWTGYQVNWNNEHLDFFHNTIWNAGEAMGSWVNGYPQSDNRVYNNYSNKEGWHEAPGFEYKNNIINATSPFENANGLNFMPKSNGSVVNSGRVIAGFEKAYKGSAPDIGAYERGGTRWTAGIDAIEDTGEGDAANDQIVFINLSTTIASQTSYDFEVQYSADTNRDIVVQFWSATEWLGQKRVTVGSGSDTIIVTVDLPTAPIPGSGYVYKADIRPVGTSWQETIDTDQINNVTVQGQTLEDKISFSNSPNSMAQATSYTLDVNYEASSNREIVMSFWSATGWIAAQEEVVTAGTGSKAITIDLPNIPQPGSGYLFKVHIRPVGTTWQDALATDQTNDITVTELFTQLIPNGIYHIESPQNNERLLARALESHSARMHKPANFDDQKWEIKHISDNSYTIKNVGTNRYLEVPYARCENGSNVGTWINDLDSHKKWKIVKNGNDIYGIKPMHCLSRALDRAGGTIGTNAIIWNYSSTNTNQKWKVLSVGNRQDPTSDNSVLAVYPNPSKESIAILGVEANDIITIYDITGKTIKKTKLTSGDELISISDIESGVYILSVFGKSKTQFVKE